MAILKTEQKVDLDAACFVFGSNLGGIHGAGAAKYAHQHRGAEWGKAVGMTGTCYAIPTKGVISIRDPNQPKGGFKRINKVGDTLTLREIKAYVDMFIMYAKKHPEMQFQITRIGCGLAGLRDSEIAPLFKDAPENCFFDSAWMAWVGVEPYRYWGTY